MNVGLVTVNESHHLSIFRIIAVQNYLFKLLTSSVKYANLIRIASIYRFCRMRIVLWYRFGMKIPKLLF